MIQSARMRAHEIGIPCDITSDDIDIPHTCPILGIKLDSSECGLKPSLDRIVPRLGYVKGNVCVISMRANRIKSDATADELRRIVNYIDEHSNPT